MILPADLRQRLQSDAGCRVTEACNRCGKLLGAVRFTYAGDSGAWCSRTCKDGVAHRLGRCRGCDAVLTGKRRGAIYCGRTCRMRVVRRDVQDSPIIINMPIQNAGLTDTKIGSGYHPTRRPENAHIVNGMENQSA
jgi:flavoprotein